MPSPSLKRHLWIPVSLALLFGCQSSSDKVRQLDQERASWEATSRLGRELFKRGAVPAEYARQLSKVVAEGLEQTRNRAAKISQ
jgi:hypothetical protein